MKELIEKLENEKFNTNITASGILTIQQTQRNKLKSQAVKVLHNFFKENLPREVNVDLVASGIILSVYNDHLQKEICLEINPTVKSLDFDVENEIEAYKIELKEKEEKRKADEIKKQKKIENDKRIRAETAKLRKEKGI